MEIQDFVETTLRQIFTAIKNIDEEDIAPGSLAIDNSEHTGGITFDLAVSAESTKDGGAKAGVKVLEVIEVGGDRKSSTKESSISRVKFSING